MSTHSSLPRNLLQSKSKGKAKIFSPGMSPARNITTSFDTSHRRESVDNSSERSASQSRSQHKLRSKEKPINGFDSSNGKNFSIPNVAKF